MYWDNEIHTIDVPSDSDILFKSQHGGQHCLFYAPAVPIADIARQTSLQGLCDWANQQISQHGRTAFTADPARHYDAANLVKINQMVHSVARHGSVKPMLLHYTGALPYSTGTGDTRLRAIERLPTVTHVSAIISTHRRHQPAFKHHQEIHTLADFAGCFGVDRGQFLIRLTDCQAPYGLDWYEYVLDDPAVSVPDWDFCLRAIQNYINHRPGDWRFEPSWFDLEIDWAALAANG